MIRLREPYVPTRHRLTLRSVDDQEIQYKITGKELLLEGKFKERKHFVLLQGPLKIHLSRAEHQDKDYDLILESSLVIEVKLERVLTNVSVGWTLPYISVSSLLETASLSSWTTTTANVSGYIWTITDDGTITNG